jgi:hypothetical protein
LGLFDVPRDDIKRSVDEFVLHELELVMILFFIKSNLAFFFVFDVFSLCQGLSVFEDRVFLKVIVVSESISDHFELFHSVDWSVVTRESDY